MSFVNRPEQTRTNATRSRCRGSMFAWILNTNPVKRLVGRRHHSRIALTRLRRRRELDQRLEERLEPEVGQGAAEEDRRLPSREILRHVELRAGGTDHVQRLAEMRVLGRPDHLPRVRIVERRHVDRRPILSLRLAFVSQQRLAADVVHAPKPLGAANGPVDRGGGDSERALEIVHQLQGIARRTVELVDERQDRQPVTLAHLEQLPCLIFDAVRRVDHHHDAVGRDQGAIGVFAEILVARRIEQRHPPPLQLELERGGRNRDAPLLFELHPVGRGVTAGFAAANGARKLNRSRIQQQLFRQRRLARVGVRDDREGTPPRHLAFQLAGRGWVREVRDVRRWWSQSTLRHENSPTSLRRWCFRSWTSASASALGCSSACRRLRFARAPAAHGFAEARASRSR